MTSRFTFLFSLCLLTTSLAWGDDPGVRECLEWGGSTSKNNASTATGIPTEWSVGEYDYREKRWDASDAEGLVWMADLGSECYNAPIVAGDKVFIGTNNGSAHLERYTKDVDLGVMLAFQRDDGAFLWQYSSPKLDDSDIDWPEQGICSTPLVRGDRMWFVSNRNEVVCLDTNGFHDGENDGPVIDEANDGVNEADVVWRFDMCEELGAVPHNMACCSPTALGDLLFVSTSNGTDPRHKAVVRPEAPSFACLDMKTGELVWSDDAPGENILDGQWGSPAVGLLGGVPQVLFPGGDGWLYAYRAARADDGRAELLWKFDCNPKDTEWDDGYGERNQLVATPMIDDGLVYIATGQDPELGDGQGDLWCIDPTKRGDVSAEVLVDVDGRPLPPKRTEGVDEDAGERVEANHNSAAVWNYRGSDADGDGEIDFEETFHRTLGMATAAEGMLLVADFSGFVHVLDLATGEPLWRHDMMATVFAAPLVVDGKIIVADTDGDVAVFALSREKKLLAECMTGDAIHASPTAVDGELYIATRARLFRVGKE